MKQFLFLCFVAISTALNVTNKTSSTNNNLIVNDEDDDDDGNLYMVDVLLDAGGAFASKVDQNDTGLSIRLTAHDGTASAWHRLYINHEETNYFGQRRYILPGHTRDLGVISSVSIRIDKPELAASSMPYYLCLHGILNNTMNENWNGCAYIQSSIENTNNDDHEYPLRDVNGKLF